MQSKIANYTHQIEEFSKSGFTMLRQALSSTQVEIYSTYALLQRFNGHYTDATATNSKDHYGDVLGESLLLHFQPIFEIVSRRKLFPTYSYLRIYQTGAVMEKHTDRPACEISASLTLGYQASSLWPLWLESQGKAQANLLDGGDLLLYRGCDVPHWRDTFSGKYWIQIFFHYVDASGPNAEHKFDRRILLGQPSACRRPAIQVEEKGNNAAR